MILENFISANGHILAFAVLFIYAVFIWQLIRAARLRIGGKCYKVGQEFRFEKGERAFSNNFVVIAAIIVFAPLILSVPMLFFGWIELSVIFLSLSITLSLMLSGATSMNVNDSKVEEKLRREWRIETKKWDEKVAEEYYAN